MKTFITVLTLTIFFFGITTETFSQDVIILKTGEELQTKVEVIDIDIVKYKKFENQTGPTYSLEKTKIFMIKYENGSKDVFDTQVEVKKEAAISEIAVNTPSVVIQQPLRYIGRAINQNGRYLEPFEIRSLMSNNPAALSSYNSGRTFKAIGGFFDIMFYVNMGWGLWQGSKGNDYDAIISLGAAVMDGVLNLILSGIGNGKIEQSVNLYNQKAIYNLSYNFKLKPNEVGFVVHF